MVVLLPFCNSNRYRPILQLNHFDNDIHYIHTVAARAEQVYRVPTVHGKNNYVACGIWNHVFTDSDAFEACRWDNAARLLYETRSIIVSNHAYGARSIVLHRPIATLDGQISSQTLRLVDIIFHRSTIRYIMDGLISEYASELNARASQIGLCSIETILT